MGMVVLLLLQKREFIVEEVCIAKTCEFVAVKLETDNQPLTDESAIINIIDSPDNN